MIVPMKKITILGLSAEKEAVLSTLSALACIHLINLDVIDLTERCLDHEKREMLNGKIKEINDTLVFIDEAIATAKAIDEGKKVKHKDKLLKTGVEIDFDRFQQASNVEYNIFSKIIDPVLTYSSRIKDIEAETKRLKQTIADLTPYVDMPYSFNEIADTKNTSMVLGRTHKLKENDLGVLRENFPDAEFEFFGAGVLFAVCIKDVRGALLTALSAFEFAPCSFDFENTAKGKINEIKINLARLKEETLELYKACASFSEYLPQLKVLFDYYSVTLQKQDAERDIVCTEKTFILKAWFPKEEEERIKKALDETAELYILFEEPTDDEIPPTATINSKAVTPFSAITNMYSAPNYREKDPNLFVSLFFFIFFGIMIADAAYGIILALGGLTYVLVKKPEKGKGNLFKLIGISGVSAVIWGVLFGSWFSIESDNPFFTPLLFSPFNEPIMMMGLSLALGAVHLAFGLILGGVRRIQHRKYLDAIFDYFTWAAVMIGFLMLLAGVGFMPELVNIGMYVIAGAMGVIVLTAGRKKKGIFGKIVGGLGGLYNIINYFSDIMSYLRVFGLALASGVIGMVFNILGQVLMGNPVSAVFGIIIYVFGHALNIALGVLSAYVHSMRLQHMEFFGKFYEGEGIPFKPYAAQTKYVVLK